MKRNWSCPDCGGVMVMLETPPKCWICNRQLEEGDAIGTGMAPRPKAPATPPPPALPAGVVMILCHLCQNDHPFSVGQMPDRCPTCGTLWPCFVGCGVEQLDLTKFLFSDDEDQSTEALR